MALALVRQVDTIVPKLLEQAGLPGMIQCMAFREVTEEDRIRRREVRAEARQEQQEAYEESEEGPVQEVLATREYWKWMMDEALPRAPTPSGEWGSSWRTMRRRTR